MVNGKKINVPSYKVLEGDVISVDPKMTTEELKTRVEENAEMPDFVEKEGLSGKLVRMPVRDDVANPVDYQLVIEFYSR